MGRNRRQQRLRERRSTRESAPAQEATTTGSGASRGTGGGGGGGKPAWRETIDSWGGFTVIGAIAAAVVIGALLVFLNRPGASEGGEEYVAQERNAPVSGAVMGDPNAPVRIIEYADFQCPFCRRFHEEVKPTLVEEYVDTGKATLEFRHYAFLGPESQQAAEAAACAADQNRFWDYHDLVFLRQGNSNTGVFSDSNLTRYARTIGDTFDDFDVQAWESCFNANTYEVDIEAEAQAAANAGIASTPSVLINGVRIEGLQPIDSYRNAIEAALAGAGGG